MQYKTSQKYYPKYQAMRTREAKISVLNAFIQVTTFERKHTFSYEQEIRLFGHPKMRILV